MRTTPSDRTAIRAAAVRDLRNAQDKLDSLIGDNPFLDHVKTANRLIDYALQELGW